MTTDRDWTMLYKAGAAAALLAGLVFRRNFGAEVSLFTGFDSVPNSISDWYSLLQSNPFVGLSFLAVFDIANYILVGLLLLALGAALWQVNKSLTAISLTSGLVGVTVNLSSNISLSMLSLSQQYAASTAEEQKAALQAAGQAILASNDPSIPWPNTGVYIGVLLIAIAGLLFSVLLLRSNRKTAIVGLLASGFDLGYCLTFSAAPTLQVFWLASAGLFWMIWHLLIARFLFRHAKR